jgi:hypothetical protein
MRSAIVADVCHDGDNSCAEAAGDYAEVGIPRDGNNPKRISTIRIRLSCRPSLRKPVQESIARSPKRQKLFHAAHDPQGFQYEYSCSAATHF